MAVNRLRYSEGRKQTLTLQGGVAVGGGPSDARSNLIKAGHQLREHEGQNSTRLCLVDLSTRVIIWTWAWLGAGYVQMRSIKETKPRWEATFAGQSDIADLKAAVEEEIDSPCIVGLRSVCWKVFLLFHDLDRSKWMKTLSDSRSAYMSMKEYFLKNIENSDDLTADDPLNDSETSPWNTLRLDEELRAEIWQDVERCMPENAYFREPHTQTMLLDILFVYCKLNRDIGYRQGMHEVLAPILWAVSCDAVDPAGLEKEEDGVEELAMHLDHSFVEHDAFTLFGKVMQTVRTFYETGSNNDPATSGLLNNSPIVERSKRIHEHYLQQTDPELAEHLTAVEVLPQIFLIRWVRLIFGREFPFEDVLALWDILFAEDPGLDLIDLVSVSMLLRIRWQLLEADYTGALTLLLRYPTPTPPHSASTFVSDALYLRDNLTLDGGDHIISKYSARVPETTVTRKLPKKVKRARTADQAAAQRALAAESKKSESFAKENREQRDISGLIQDAAKGVYLQGEKWGVAKALRGAVQGIQVANATPRRASERSQWSLDNGKLVTESSPTDLIARIEALEQRNKALAKMLENATSELWTLQKAAQEEKQDETSTNEALGLAVARVQFVQVYLENSNMALPSDSLSPAPEEQLSSGKSKGHAQPKRTKRHQVSSSLDGMNEAPLPRPRDAVTADTSTQSPPWPAQASHAPSTPDKTHKDSTAGSTQRGLSPSLQPRPALAQSSYSWMLGEEQRKSAFVAASPFASASRDARGRKGSLFGSEEDDGTQGRGSKAGKRDSRVRGLGLDGEDGDKDDDVFTMGALKAKLDV